MVGVVFYSLQKQKLHLYNVLNLENIAVSMISIIIFYNSILGTFCVCVISADEHCNFYAAVKAVIFLMLFSKDQVTGIQK